MAPSAPPPLWRTLTRFDKSQLAPWMGLRNAFGVAVALATGLALQNPGAGLIAGTGALDAAFSDGPDPYLQRGSRMMAATLWVAVAVFAGRLCGGNHALAVMLEAVCAFTAGMIVALGETPGNIGTIALVTLIVFSAQPAPLGNAVSSGLLIVAGGALQTLLSIALWPVRRFRPEARALGTLYAELARIADTEAKASAPPPATEPILAARKALEDLVSVRSVEGERYLALFSQAERIRLALLMLSRLRTRIGRDSDGAKDAAQVARAMELAARMLRSIAAALNAGIRGDPLPECVAELSEVADRLRGRTGMPADARWQLAALSGQLRVATELAAHVSPEGGAEFHRMEMRKPRWLRLMGAFAVIRANLSLNSAVCRHALRMAGCVAVADLLVRSLHWERAYWAPMTAAIVLKPDFTTTLTRGLLRVGGTMTGLAVATGLFAILTPAPMAQVLLIGAFMFLMRWAGGANYGVLVLALTSLVVLLFALIGVPPGQVIAARALNTLAGGAIVLTANWIWPTWERTLIRETVARLLDAYREYFQVVRDGYLHPGIERDADYATRLDQVRQAGRLARSNAEASAERYRIEGRVPADRVTALHAILANSHRLIHAVMALEAGIYRSHAVPARAEFGAFANAVDSTLYFLASYLRGAPLEPGDLPDLREMHAALIAAGDPGEQRYALVNIETDRVTNSLNTLAIETVQWLASGYSR